MGHLTYMVFAILPLFSIITISSAVIVNRTRKLDEDYVVSWFADLDKQRINFTVVAKTKGYVGLGLSPQGGMSNADVVIGGVNDNGEPYFTDRFSTGKYEPKIDESQDWTLLAAEENDTHTILKFERALNTCDEEDLTITNGTTKLIWAIGATDDIKYHAKRGSSAVYILDPAIPTFDASKFQPWNISVNTKLPTQDTTYWCTVHKSPVYTKEKVHIVGFKVMLDNEEAMTHNHHLILTHCVNTPTNNNTDLYEKFLTTNHPGGACYDDDGSGISDLLAYCQTKFYAWGKGGDPLLLPENVGFPLNENRTQEYFLLEIHYDNPKMLQNLQYETGLQVLTTPDLREEEAGILSISQVFGFSLIIPPNSTDYVINGHCSSECTESTFPEDGVTVFNAGLHSHLAGRKMKVRHFRAGMELPWVANDDSYDFNYQQNRPLLENRQILKGDQLTVECTYSSAHLQPPAAILGGFKTTQEMCYTFIMYWPKLSNLQTCSSVFAELPWMFEKFGIQAIDLNGSSLNYMDPLVTSPKSMAGKHFSEVISTMVNWTAEFKDEFQQKTRFSNHLAVCPGTEDENVFAHSTSSDTVSQLEGTINYPKDLVSYRPPTEVCYPTHYGSSTPESSSTPDRSSTPDMSSTPKGNSGGLHAVAFFFHTLAMSFAALTLL